MATRDQSGLLLALFNEIRRISTPRAWSRGVELARSGAVLGESRDADEIVLRVAVRGSPVASRVTLWPPDCEWDCECASRHDACFHVAAAVIALRRAEEAGDDLPTPGTQGARIGYRLQRTPEGLFFDRVIVRGGDNDDDEDSETAEKSELVETPLKERLTAEGRKRIVGAATLFTTAADLAVEVALGARQRGVLPVAVMRKILGHLGGGDERAADVRLDDAPIRVDPEPVRPHIKVRDDPAGEGFLVKLVLDPAVSERFANGVVRCDETLRPTAGLDLKRDEILRLRRGITYPISQANGLVCEVLPYLEKVTTLHYRSSRLPDKGAKGEELRPRLAFETERSGDALAILPTIVYGDPPVARIDGHRLVLLGKTLPERDRGAEERLRRKLLRRADLSPGRPALYRGEEAIAAVPRLAALGELRGAAHHAFFQAEPLEIRLGSTAIAGLPLTFFARSRVGAGGPNSSNSSQNMGSGTPNSTDHTTEVDAEAVIAAWERGESLVPLKGGGFAPLPADWLARYGPHLAFLLAARGADGSLKPWARPALAELAVDLNAPDLDPDLASLRALVDDFRGLPAPELPSDLRAELRDYQEAGVRWLAFLRRAGLGGLLADDMGLGKTLQTLCVLEAGAPALVVVPTSVLHAWEDELRRFRPGLRVHRYYGPGRQLDPSADVTLTTYALLRRDLEQLRGAPTVGDSKLPKKTKKSPTEDQEPIPWDTVVLDEAQTIKNPESQVAQAAFRLVARHRLALTGTPVENRLDELWSLLFFLNPGLLGSRRDFRERFADPLALGSPEAAAALRLRIRPFILRRRKSEVARELPPRTEIVLRCQLGRRERELYNALQAATRAEVAAQLAGGSGGSGGLMKALEALLRLRQAACHRGLIPGQEAATSSKVELLRDTLTEIVAEGHKALVFSQWTSLLDRIEPVLRRAGLAFCRLDGTTRDREAVVRAFQSPDEGAPPVMLISLKAGGTGLTLTAADHVFLVDPWWNPAVEDQAADRAHRIGQDRPVLIHRLVAEDTVEERILALQARKRALAEAALGEADRAVGLTKEDLLALLE